MLNLEDRKKEASRITGKKVRKSQDKMIIQYTGFYAYVYKSHHSCFLVSCLFINGTIHNSPKTPMTTVRKQASAGILLLNFTSINLDFSHSLLPISLTTNWLGGSALWNYFSLLVSEKTRDWRWDVGLMIDAAIIYSSDVPYLWWTDHNTYTVNQNKYHRYTLKGFTHPFSLLLEAVLSVLENNINSLT